MIRLARLSLVVSVLLAIAVSGALAVGRLIVQPTNLQTLGFGVCDGQPCFRGIVPGVTLWEEAKKGLPEYAVLPDGATYNSTTNERIIDVWGNSGLPVNGVGYLGMNKSPDVFLAQFIAIFGLPCRLAELSFSGNVFFATLHYAQITARISFSRIKARIEPQSVVADWELYANTDGCKPLDLSHGGYTTLPGDTLDSPWRGFASLRRYGLTTP